MSLQCLRAALARVLLAGAVLLPAAVTAAESDQQNAASETLAAIRHRGSIVVGVKTDYPPFGMLDAQGNGVGLEHDLAADVARRLGVRLTKVSVTGANRLQKLEEGAVDLVLATTGDTADRRRISTIVEPNYYASGVTLFARPEQKIREWADIRGKQVCVAQGSYYNRPMGQRYLLELVTFNTPRDARLAVRDGRCVGFLFDNTAIQADLQQPQWAGYRAALPPAMSVPWGLAIARKERGSELEQLLGDIVADWHRSGFLLEREKAWQLPPSKFLQDANALWNRKNSAGDYVCQRNGSGAWPGQCRNPAFLTAQEVGGLHSLGLWLRDSYGVDLSFAYDAYDRSRFLSGLGWTVGLMFLCVTGSLAYGLMGAMGVEAGVPILSPLLRVMAIHGQMTPPLLNMYLWMFGIGALLWELTGLGLPALLVAVGCLSYYTGAAIQRALLQCCDHQRQLQAGYRLRWSTLRAILPLASPPVTAALVNVAKATMMSSVLAIPELLSAATSIMADTGNVAVMMNALLCVFVVLIALTIRALHWLERRLQQSAGEAP
jgi:polar amino acid transport system substrate-binding protein